MIPCGKAAIVLVLFNRPDTTARVFEAIRQARPGRLFVVADGPRADREGDVALCNTARQATEKVNWPCEVARLYSDENLGCRAGVIRGLNWVFEQVEEAIILEDDCVPDPSFFPFCNELLARYRDEPRVGMISGNNVERRAKRLSNSYTFTRHCHIWGWATWRRAWEKYDSYMSGWPVARKSRWLESFITDPIARHYWRSLFDDSHRDGVGSLSSWDIPWIFTCWEHNFLSVIPSHNLVLNCGFGEGATHTRTESKFFQKPVHSIEFPLSHPEMICSDPLADGLVDRTRFYGQTPAQYLFWKLRLPFKVSTVRQFRHRIDQILSCRLFPRWW